MTYDEMMYEVEEWLDKMKGYGSTDYSFADNGDSVEVHAED